MQRTERVRLSSTPFTHQEESWWRTEVGLRPCEVNQTQRGCDEECEHWEHREISCSQRGPQTINRPTVIIYCLRLCVIPPASSHTTTLTLTHTKTHTESCYHFLSHFPASANKLFDLNQAFVNEARRQKRRPRSTCDRTWAALSLTICLRLYLTPLAHTHSTHTPHTLQPTGWR